MLYAGLDLGKRTVYGTILDEQGNVIKQDHFPNEERDFQEFFKDIHDVKAVIEATCTWQRAYEFLEKMHIEVTMAHPLRVRAIADARIKTDAIDAATLAHLLRTNLIPKSYIPCKEIRDLRELIAHRAGLVRTRTQLKNRVHAVLINNGIRIPFADVFCKHGISLLLDSAVKEKLQVTHYLDQITLLNEKIQEVDKLLAKQSKKKKDVKLLQTIPGIGTYSAMAILSAIADIHRFASAQKLCSYAGMVPTIYQSGDTRRLGRISKQGNTVLKNVLIQSAVVAVRTKADNALKYHYKRLAKRIGKKKAIVATARKMLVIMYHMLQNQEAFRE